jgi:hypothetical protein
MKTTYNLTSSAREGSLKLTYENGLLIAFEISFKPAVEREKHIRLFSTMPVLEPDLAMLENLGLTVTKEALPNEKLALFCRIYEKHKAIKYKVTAADAGKIKQINPTEEQLHAYFRSENFLFKGKQSIANLVKYWNEFRAELAGAGKKQYPNEWNPDLIKKLSPQETMDYYRHLKSLGLEPVKAGGQVVGFK